MSTPSEQSRAKRRIHHFAALKQQGQKIAVVTAYDYPTGCVADQSGADAVLVGDSLGMVALGLDSTIPVTMDIMVHHTAAVSRGVKRAFLISDMPFLSYHVSREQTVKNAGRLIQNGNAEAVKLEGGREVADNVKAITGAGIPVMGHIGLVPQSIHKLGGYKVQGREAEAAQLLIEDALALQDAGAFSIVLEAMPADIASVITEKVSIPTIGIGAGRECSGQVLVLSDLVGMLPGSVPKFVKQYAGVGTDMVRAAKDFCDDVRSGSFPDVNHEY